jgi:hypothetical protein
MRPLAILLVLAGVARADLTAPPAAAPPSACALPAYPRLKRAVARFCNADPTAHPEGCRDLRRALRRCAVDITHAPDPDHRFWISIEVGGGFGWVAGVDDQRWQVVEFSDWARSDI